MQHSITTQISSTTGANGPVAAIACGLAVASVCLPANFYYGYWFSHWRA